MPKPFKRKRTSPSAANLTLPSHRYPLPPALGGSRADRVEEAKSKRAQRRARNQRNAERNSPNDHR